MTVSRLQRLFLPALSFALAHLLVACGSDDGSSSESLEFVESSPETSADLAIENEASAPSTDGYTSADSAGAVQGESYDLIIDNPFLTAVDKPLSTFSIDVDAASYSNVRRFLNDGRFPPRDAVRIEEMINYFSYAYPQPTGEDPFAIYSEIAECPWDAGHRLVHIGLQGKDIPAANLPASSLVFLIDVSGSMADGDKLPLLKSAFTLLVEKLRPQDYVSIVVYAGGTGVVLEPTSGAKKEEILRALDRLEAGGSTAGGAGIERAYDLAEENFLRQGNNRVILATDGDFNVGVSDEYGLVRLIEKEREKGIFLSVLGFGTGNLQDAKMEEIADNGNGNYYYIDNLSEARKVLVSEMGGTLNAIAKDVKIQIEFNPAKVRSYRLIGYENRMLRAQDFNDDKRDAGELGAGHTVTAIYEIVPADAPTTGSSGSVDPLRYQKQGITDLAAGDEMMQVKLRYKRPAEDLSRLISVRLADKRQRFNDASVDFRFSAAVAGFGMLLRGSQYKGELTFDDVIEIAEEALGPDRGGYRHEFVELVRTASEMGDVATTE